MNARLTPIAFVVMLAMATLSCIGTPTPTISAPPGVTDQPTRRPLCTPPLCAAGEVYYCPSGDCPGGCGTGCATPTPGLTPIIMCTPPLCAPGEVFYCSSGDCPGGCGTTCVTPTPGITQVPVCTPPRCAPGDVFYCPSGNCPGGCGTTCATATPGGTPLAIIDYLRANVSEADPGATITLEWSFSGAPSGTLHAVTFSGELDLGREVEPRGTLTYTLPPEQRNRAEFMLFVESAGQMQTASLTIAIRCPDAWFFEQAPPECPSGPAVQAEGAEQPFENGTMLWNRAEDRIYVLFSDGRQPAWEVYPNEWREGTPEPEPAVTPPAGRYAPVRGFGTVWREQPGVRDRLGWAVHTEAGYATVVQSTARYKYNTLYIRALDGGVWALGPERSSWQHIP